MYFGNWVPFYGEAREKGLDLSNSVGLERFTGLTLLDCFSATC